MAGLNSVSSGHTNFAPGLLTGDTSAQVDTCTKTSTHIDYQRQAESGPLLLRSQCGHKPHFAQ
jgi:hypothetical protein